MPTFMLRNLHWLKKQLEKNQLLLALVVVLAVALLGTWLGWYNDKIIPVKQGAGYAYRSSDPLRVLSNWDGPDYIAIAQHGYTNVSSTNYFPLYPMLIRAGYYIVRSYLVSAVIVAWACLIGAVYFYIGIAKHIGVVKNSSEIFRASLTFLFLPTAVFLFATYPMSLVAMLGLGSVYFALKKRWGLTAILLLLATTSHILGLFFLVLSVLILIESNLPTKKIISTVSVGMLGTLLFMIYLYYKYNDILSFIKSQHSVHGWLGTNYYRLLITTDVLNIVFCLLILLAAIYYWSRRKSFSIFVGLFLLIPLVGGQWGGFNRYILIAFPIPLMLFDYLKHRVNLYISATTILVVLWAYTLLQYAGGYIGS